MSKKDEKTIAQQIEEFETLIAWFNSEEFSLEEALKNYEKAEKLSQAIESQLESLKHEVTVLKQKFDQ